MTENTLTAKLQTPEPHSYHRNGILAFQVFYVHGRGSKGDTVPLESTRLKNTRIHNSVYPFSWKGGTTPNAVVLTLDEHRHEGLGMLIEVIGERDG